MHIYTIQEAVHAAQRLIDAGMSMKHAVNLTAAAFGLQPDDLYRAMVTNGND